MSLYIWLMALAFGSVSSAAPDVLDHVNPLIGTSNGGHVFSGATLPFGMAKAVADSVNDNAAGYASDRGYVTGFSQMHDSGTGGASLGLFPLFPQSGCRGGILNNCYFTKPHRTSAPLTPDVQSRPGYFSLTLNTSITVEMTVSNRTALHRFTFPEEPVPMKGGPTTGSCAIPNEPLILIDLSDLSDTRSKGNVTVDPDSGRITGSATFNPSFARGTFTAYFCADFKGASIKGTGIFQNNRASTDFKSLKTQTSTIDGPPVPAGAFVQFDKPAANNRILARVGVSFISEDQACSNAEKEISNFDFDGTVAIAEDAWRTKLGVVEVDTTGVNSSIATAFWSALYRTFVSPQDYTGENPLWESSEPYYDSYYCIWDTFRSTQPLLTLIDPYSQTQMGWTQGGSNADVVLVDAFLKGLNKDIDWATGYEAIVNDAENEPANWAIEGHGGLTSWKNLGYIPTDDFDPIGVGIFTRSISRTVEYSYNDFCIAEMAQALNKSADAEKYFKRSRNWANMFNENQDSFFYMLQSDGSIGYVDSGFRGFLQPRYLNGTFGYQDAMMCSPMYEDTGCFLLQNGRERLALHILRPPRHGPSLITTLGGPEAFVDRLRFLHETPRLLYIGDEQAFNAPFLFHYAGRPGLSSYFAHYYIPAQFNDAVDGLPGNDDSGAIAAFTALIQMGMWPMPGQDVYLILPPFFREVNITNPLSGKTATIRNINFDAGYENIYIQSATLNNATYTKNWITHDFFQNGGVLELTLGKNESTWGTKTEDLPPSLGLDN